MMRDKDCVRCLHFFPTPNDWFYIGECMNDNCHGLPVELAYDDLCKGQYYIDMDTKEA
jgi:hypothetical protein